jgi:hypothetical protein
MWDCYLWIGGPVGELLESLPDLIVLQDVEMLEGQARIMQDFHQLPAESTLRVLHTSIQMKLLFLIQVRWVP